MKQDKHPQITNYLSKIVKEFYQNKGNKQTKVLTVLKRNKMKATIKQAERNDRNLTVIKTGYGHWRISCDYRGKRISTVTTHSVAVDNFNSEFGEKQDGRNRVKEGYEDLINEIIRVNNY